MLEGEWYYVCQPTNVILIALLAIGLLAIAVIVLFILAYNWSRRER